MWQIKTSTRVVILTKSFAIKIPIDFRGWLQGINERLMWNKYGHHEPFAPLVWSCCGIVCQRRCQPIDVKIDVHAWSMKQRIVEFQFTNCDLYKPANWGMYNGKIVLLDYGISKRIAAMY